MRDFTFEAEQPIAKRLVTFFDGYPGKLGYFSQRHISRAFSGLLEPAHLHCCP